MAKEKNEVVHVNNALERAVSNAFDVQQLVKIGTVAFRNKVNTQLDVTRKDFKKAAEELKAAEDALSAELKAYSKAVESSKDAKNLVRSLKFLGDCTVTCTAGVTYRDVDTASLSVGINVVPSKPSTDKKLDLRGNLQLSETIPLPAKIKATVDYEQKCKDNHERLANEIADLSREKTQGVVEFTESLEAGLYKKYLTTVPDGAEVVEVIGNLVDGYVKSSSTLTKLLR